MKHLAIVFASLFLFACAPVNEATIPGNGDERTPAAYEPLTDAEPKFVESDLVSKARAYLADHQGEFSNQNYLAVVDFSQHSAKARFTLVDLRGGRSKSIRVAHGKNSDPSNSGYATQFSNKNGSLMSSLGFYRTAETYTGKNGLSLRIDGLESTNSNARSRAVVIHGSNYVYDYEKKSGRSYGCPALSKSQYKDVINKLKGGALLYIAR